MQSCIISYLSTDFRSRLIAATWLIKILQANNVSELSRSESNSEAGTDGVGMAFFQRMTCTLSELWQHASRMTQQNASECFR